LGTGDRENARYMFRSMADLSDDFGLNTIKHARNHGPCRLPNDPEYGNRDEQANQRIGKGKPQPYADGADDHRQAGKSVSACMVTIGDQGCAVDLTADLDPEYRHRLIAEKANQAGDGYP